MRKAFLGIFFLLYMTIGMVGCVGVGEKAASLSAVYGAVAFISLLLLLGCLYLVRKKRTMLILLFSSVLVVNIGYTFLALSTNLEMALQANRIAYLGSVFLPFSMLMIILDVTNTGYKQRVPVTLLVLAVSVFLLAASPGILDIYYKEVSFEIVNGAATLKKVYGPLHLVYLVYLVGYFATMVAVIVRASVKKTIDTVAHAVVIAIAVFVNIGVWFIEQLTDMDFEFLAISYIISELFLLGVHLVMKENQRLKDLVAQKEETLHANKNKEVTSCEDISEDAMAYFQQGFHTLTPTEREIYDAYLQGTSTKEIMSTLGIKENTLKFHNKNIYSKLGVSSRKQLVAVHRAIERRA